MKPVQQIIFDVDGTLLDTEFETSRITAALANEHGCPISAEDVFVHYAGLGAREKFSGIAKAYGVTLTEEDLAEMERLHEERKAQIYQQPVIPVVEHVPETLKKLGDAGYVMSVGSSNNTDRSRAGLTKTGLAAYFNNRFYGPDLTGGKKKPDPAVYNLAINDNKSLPANTVVVDDTEPGIVAGDRAGATVIGYLDPRFKGADAARKIKAFRAAGAEMIVRDFKDIPAKLGLPASVKNTTPAPKMSFRK